MTFLTCQRYARNRAFRDAEDRAAGEVAEHLPQRLAAFFSTGLTFFTAVPPREVASFLARPDTRRRS